MWNTKAPPPHTEINMEPLNIKEELSTPFKLHVITSRLESKTTISNIEILHYVEVAEEATVDRSIKSKSFSIID
jgi:hypothetical protein